MYTTKTEGFYFYKDFYKDHPVAGTEDVDEKYKQVQEKYKHWIKSFPNFKNSIDFAYRNIKGEQLSNKYHIKTCYRYFEDLLNPKLSYDITYVEEIVRNMSMFYVLPDGQSASTGESFRGNKFKLFDFQNFFIYSSFPFFDGFRAKYKEIVFLGPRKIGKTGLTCAIALGVAMCKRNRESKAYITMVANSVDQSLISFNNIKDSIELMGLQKLLVTNIQRKTITGNFGKDGFIEIQALSGNYSNQDGKKILFAICDEIHEFKTSEQYQVIKDSVKAYDATGVTFTISTAGTLLNGYAIDRFSYCKKVLDKEIDDESTYVYLREADPNKEGEIEILNPVVHQMSNPSYNILVSPRTIMEEAYTAMNSPKEMASFLPKTLNVFTRSAEAYFSTDQVIASNDRHAPATIEQIVNRPNGKRPVWFGACDMSKVGDLTAAVLYTSVPYTYRDREKNIIVEDQLDVCLCHAFIPQRTIEDKINKSRMPIYAWEKTGDITIINEPTISKDIVANWFATMRDKYGLVVDTIVYDPAYGTHFDKFMKKRKFNTYPMRQTALVKSEGFRHIESKILNKNFYYFSNGAFEYCIANVAVKENLSSNNLINYEKISNEMKMDVFDAAVMAAKAQIEAGTTSIDRAKDLEFLANQKI